MAGGPLPETEIRARLAAHPGWEYADGRLRRSWEFPDFAAALDFVNRVGEVCERLDHHADFAFGWGRATVETWSHDAGGVTERDLRLVAEVASVEP